MIGHSRLLIVAVVVAQLLTRSISAAEAIDADKWGSISGRITVEGDFETLPPLVKKGDLNVRDATTCAIADIPDERVHVDPATKGLANVAVYLKIKPTLIHPKLENSTQKEVVFNIRGCRFVPHFMLVRTDQTIRLTNSDPVANNVRADLVKNGTTNVLVLPLNQKDVVIECKNPEKLPTRVVCDIHPWMTAQWLILDHPYMTITNSKGEFEVPNLPIGEHEFTVWHESVGYLDKSYKVTVKPGDNKLSSIHVAEKLLRPKSP